MDDYGRRKDDSYFDRYRDSFDGRGPPGPESQSRAKGKVAETLYLLLLIESLDQK